MPAIIGGGLQIGLRRHRLRRAGMLTDGKNILIDIAVDLHVALGTAERIETGAGAGDAGLDAAVFGEALAENGRVVPTEAQLGVAGKAAEGAEGFGLVLVVGSSFAFSVINTHSNATGAYFSPFTRAWELGAGAAHEGFDIGVLRQDLLDFAGHLFGLLERSAGSS